MPSESKNHWGLLLFLGSFGLIAAAMLGLNYFTATAHQWFFRTILPVAGIGFSVAAMLIGHFSYPRIHDLKVYAGGMLAGLVGIIFLGLPSLQGTSLLTKTPACFFDTIFLLIMINGLVIPFLPSSATYRTTKRITYPLLLLEAAALIMAFCAPPAMAWTLALESPVAYVSFWAPFVWAGLVVLITTRFAAAEFHLGGVLAGYAVLLATAQMELRLPPYGDNLELILFCAAQLYLIAGFAVHWFMRIEHRIAYDPLLQIYNRDYCMQILNERSKLNCTPPFAIAMVDIDHFKKVNDTYGHQTGDVVLHAVAQAVKHAVLPDGVLCRYGGEELVVFFSQQTAVEIRSIMEETREAVERTRIKSGKNTLSITISAGISHRASMTQSLSDVVAAADRALYKAKEGGRNQVKVAKTPEKKAK
jgi:diguanylate cyclase (GGDEF)-like protein